MFTPLILRAIAIAAILAALAGIYVAWAHHQRDIGREEVRAEWTADIARRNAEALKASEAVRKKEADLQTKVGSIDRDLQTQKALRATADRRSTDSLQRLNAALASGSTGSKDTATASGTDDDPRDGIIANCADSYRRMESAARIVENQVAGLQNYAGLCVN